MQSIIIGAGPAGLAVAGLLAQQGHATTLLEAGTGVGTSWRQHYDRLHLHTIKQESCLPGLAFPDTYPTYVSRQQFVDYLEQYAGRFGIRPQFAQRVTRIERSGAGNWHVVTDSTTFRADNVVVASGYNRIPNRPALPGEANFGGTILHSRDYRSGADFAGQRVLVVGMGNTGAEIALDLYEQGAQPVLSVRSPVNVVRRDTFGRPTQPFAIFLNRLPNRFYDWVAGVSQRLTVGDLAPYGLPKPPYPPSYQIRALGRIPVIDLGTIAQIKAGNIGVRPGVAHLNERSVTFTDGRALPFDAVVLATGYRPGLEALLGNALAGRVLTERGYPRSLWFNNDATLAGLYFLGFSTPLTGILRSIRLDAGRVVDHLLART